MEKAREVLRLKREAERNEAIQKLQSQLPPSPPKILSPQQKKQADDQALKHVTFEDEAAMKKPPPKTAEPPKTIQKKRPREEFVEEVLEPSEDEISEDLDFEEMQKSDRDLIHFQPVAPTKISSLKKNAIKNSTPVPSVQPDVQDQGWVSSSLSTLKPHIVNASISAGKQLGWAALLGLLVFTRGFLSQKFMATRENVHKPSPHPLQTPKKSDEQIPSHVSNPTRSEEVSRFIS